MTHLARTDQDGIPDVPVQGYRPDWVYRLLVNFDLLKTKTARSGYLSALYVLRMESLPSAYSRGADIENLQRGLRIAIGRMEQTFGDTVCVECGLPVASGRRTCVGCHVKVAA